MLLATLALVALVAPPANASQLTVAYPSFTTTNTAGFVFGGTRAGGAYSAYVPTSTPVIRVSTLTTYAAGTAFFKQVAQLGANRSFSACFSIFIHDQVPSQGADGMAFVLQNRMSYPIRVGGGLGFFGNPNSQPNSLGIEFDTFKNTTDNGVNVNDPNNNHVGVNINGDCQSAVTTAPPGNATLNSQLNGVPWNVWVDYDGTAHVLEVRMSKTTSRPTTTTLSYATDLTSVLPQDVYVGFTAGTGGLSETHDVRNLYFNNSLVPGGITPATTSYTMGPATVTQSADYLNMHTQTEQDLVATYRDSLGNPVAGATINVTATGGSVESASMVTDSNGRVTIRYTTPAAAGAYDVHAIAQGGVHADFYVTARTDYNVPIGTPSNATSLLPGAALHFPSVTSAGYASVVAQQPTTQTPSDYPVIASYNISVSDAVHTNPMTVTVPWPDYYDEDPDKASEVKLLHYTGGQWVEVQTSVDTVNLTVTGSVTSLGEFVVGVKGEEPLKLSYGATAGGSIVGESFQIVDWGFDGAAVTAQAEPGYHFVGWDDGVLTAERRELDVRADKSVTALFVSDVVIPTITGLSPGSGPAKTEVTITGTGFTAVTGVTFNGVAAASYTVDDVTQITAKVPAGATTGIVAVTNTAGTSSSTAVFTRTATTWLVPSDFLTIQSAVTNASAGDTINIASGTYIESNILVGKSLTIQGTGVSRDDVVVVPAAEDGNVDTAFGTNAQNGFIIRANDVTLKNLTLDGRGNPALTADKNNFRTAIITADSSYPGGGGGIWNNLHVDNVYVKFPYRRGIQTYPAAVSGTVVENSRVDDVALNNGMFLCGQSSALNNTIHHAFQGIVQQPDPTTPAGLIRANGNTLSDIGNYPGCWGYPNGQPRAIQFNNSDAAGRQVEIKDNTISDNGLKQYAGAVGIYTRLANSASEVSGNDITLGSGVSWADPGSQAVGMLLGWSYDNGFTASNNHVHMQDYGMGVMVFGNGTAARPLVLDGNTISSSGSLAKDVGDGTGIYVANEYLFSGTDRNPSYLILQKNNTISGFVTGLRVDKVVTSTQPLTVIARGGSFAGNATGVSSTGGTGISTDAVGNWWGAPSGPHNATANPSGAGAPVSDYVAFEPWLQGPGPCNITGVVTGFTGEPLYRMVASVWNADTGAFIRSIFTDKSGRYLFSGLPVGNYKVRYVTEAGPALGSYSYYSDKITIVQATVIPLASGDIFTASMQMKQAPVVSGFTPSSGGVGAVVTIAGEHFSDASAVHFNGTVAPEYVVNSDTQITVQVPAGATTGKLSVTTPSGTGTSAGSFTVIPAPTISGFTPASGPVGATVTINGANFTGTTVVRFNGASASFSVTNAGKITAVVPVGATTGAISVTAPGGSAESATGFTVAAPVTQRITGTVTNNAAPQDRIVVTAFDAATNAFVKSVFTNASGVYALDGLAAGSYHLRFTGTTPASLSQYYDHKTTITDAAVITLSSGTTLTISTDLAPLPPVGAISGTVSSESGPLGGVVVSAFDAGTNAYIKGVFTDSSGYYTLTVPAGEYHLRFTGTPAGLSQYYDHHSVINNATIVTLTSGGTSVSSNLSGMIGP